MGNLSLQEYYEANGINIEYAMPSWANTFYMQSNQVANGDFLNPDNLINLSEEGLQALSFEIQDGQTLFTNNLRYLQNNAGLGTNQPEVAQAIFDQDRAKFPGIDIITSARTEELFISGRYSGPETLEILQGEVDEFLMGARDALDQAIELNGQINDLAVSIVEGGTLALADNLGAIANLSDAARTVLRAEIEAQLGNADPDIIPDIDAFKEQLDGNIAELPEEHATFNNNILAPAPTLT